MKKKLLASLIALAVVAVGAFAWSMTYVGSTTVVAHTYGATATENITEMVEDLTPSFILLVFVMVFMLMLLTIVDRIGRH